MRIDSPTGIKAWLIGKFSGSFKGRLYGLADSASHATYAESGSYSESASYVKVEGVDGLDEKLQEEYLPISGGVISGSLSVIDKLIAEGKLIVKESLEVEDSLYVSGNIETDGDLRIQKAILRYDEEEDALQFLFTNRPPEEPVAGESEETQSCNCSCSCCQTGSSTTGSSGRTTYIVNNYQH